MQECATIPDFLKAPGTILDVRSPLEYTHGRIPGAINLPLFSDEERAAVGTVYKQSGRKQAIELGLRYVGPKLADFAATAQQQIDQGVAKVHCWRGGMRSASMAWLLRTAGLKAITLTGGYKVFRRWVLSTVALPKKIRMIGGLTGSGKTEILQALKQKGEQVLDLEALAHHRGSSYGMIGMPSQPTSEQFENEIAVQWAAFDLSRVVWIEDESRMIGTCKVPDALFLQMRKSPLFFIERPFQERLDILLHDYGKVDSTSLIEATTRLKKRLGGARTKEILVYIENGQLQQAIELALKYYDRTYAYGVSGRQDLTTRLRGEHLSTVQWAQQLLEVNNDKTR